MSGHGAELPPEPISPREFYERNPIHHVIAILESKKEGRVTSFLSRLASSRELVWIKKSLSSGSARGPPKGRAGRKLARVSATPRKQETIPSHLLPFSISLLQHSFLQAPVWARDGRQAVSSKLNTSSGGISGNRVQSVQEGIDNSMWNFSR
jgi:hypothetical protein